ncbi:hypothetical protein B0I26_11080 [Anoxybacillus vitaminiphilus]|uniref:Uncharacterized protein n=1 Tax=Paranoxybacillus vitaminiphilus TaxID=581036 RepID=A0A327YBE9_9BACL|nr:hypothetical protein B0I26_11080 [Anoxybacillus vitaminiphilus]
MKANIFIKNLLEGVNKVGAIIHEQNVESKTNI